MMTLTQAGMAARFHRSLLLSVLLSTPVFAAGGPDQAKQTVSPAPVEHLGRQPVVAADANAQDAHGAEAAARQKTASTVRAGEAIANLQRFSRMTRSATGRFEQIQVGGRNQLRSRGHFAFSRPGNFRWEIESPDRQLIVTDGRKLYFYDKDLQQVTVRQASESIQATPAAVLFGVGDLNDSFRLTDIGSRGGVAWIEAIPKKADSGFDQIRVGMRAGQPVVMEVIDAFGQINRFEFQNLKVLDSVPAEQFRFTPPPGVDVLE